MREQSLETNTHKVVSSDELETAEFELETSNFELESDELLEEADEFDFELDELGLETGEFGKATFGQVARPAAARRPLPALPGGVRAAIARQRRRQAGLKRAIRALRPYVRRQGNRAVISIPAQAAGQLAAKIGVPPRGVDILIRSARHWRPKPPTAMRTMRSELEFETGETCKGRSGWDWHWWGISVYLDSCNTEKLVKAIDVGTGASAFCAVIPEFRLGAACKVIAAALGLGSALVKAIHSFGNNRGIVIQRPWIGGVPIIVPQ